MLLVLSSAYLTIPRAPFVELCSSMKGFALEQHDMVSSTQAKWLQDDAVV
jgi:hypothetical protein